MSDDDLKAIEARLDATTPGVWATLPAAPGDIIVHDATSGEPYDYVGTMADENDGEANLDFVLNVRQDVRALITEVRRVRILLRRAEKLNDVIVNDRLLDSDAAQMAVRLERERVTGMVNHLAHMADEVVVTMAAKGDYDAAIEHRNVARGLRCSLTVVNSDRIAPAPTQQKAPA